MKGYWMPLVLLLVIFLRMSAADTVASRNPFRRNNSKSPQVVHFNTTDTVIDLSANPFARLFYGGLNILMRIGKTLGDALGMRAFLQRGLEGFLERSFGPLWVSSLKKLVKIGEGLADMSQNKARSARQSLDLLRYGVKQLKEFRDGEIDAPELENCTVTETVVRGARTLLRLFSVPSGNGVTGRGYHGGYGGGGGAYHTAYR